MMVKFARKTVAFCKSNRDGLWGVLAIAVAIGIVWFIHNSNDLTLSESDILDHSFTNCTLSDGEEGMCPIHRLNHTMLFRYHGVYIDPYSKNGMLDQEFVFFEYRFCRQIPAPKFPSNYQAHCNLLSAGIGTEVTTMFGLTLSVLSLAHALFILSGFFPWSAYHKFDWVFSVIAACFYMASCIIWQFLGHIDIISNHALYSEAHGGMKVDTRHGSGFWMTAAAAVASWFGAFKLRVYIWSMGIELFKFKYAESEKSSLSLDTQDWEFIRGSGTDTASLR